MTTPSPAERRRPRLLVLVVLAWAAAAALAVGGSFAPIFTETETASTPSTSSDSSESSSSTPRGSSVEVTPWEQTTMTDGSEMDRPSPGTWFGLPIVMAAAVLFAGGVIGFGSLLTGSDSGLRLSTAIAGAGSAVLLGSVATVGMVVKSLSDEFAAITTTVGRSDYYSVEAGIGKGMWLLVLAALLGAVAVCVALIARHRIGPYWLRPAESKPREDDAPATPSFGVPVIRPVGYD